MLATIGKKRRKARNVLQTFLGGAQRRMAAAPCHTFKMFTARHDINHGPPRSAEKSEGPEPVPDLLGRRLAAAVCHMVKMPASRRIVNHRPRRSLPLDWVASVTGEGLEPPRPRRTRSVADCGVYHFRHPGT